MKEYFDFSMTFEVLVNGHGVSRDIFRKFGEFNFYVFVIYTSKKFKSLFKVNYGKETILKKSDDVEIYMDNLRSVKI